MRSRRDRRAHSGRATSRRNALSCGLHQRAHSACERWLRREPIFADLCTLLHTHGRSRDRAGPRVPRHRRPHGPRDARTLGPEAHAAGAVTQPPTHTSSRSLPFWTLAINRLHGRNRDVTTNVGAWRNLSARTQRSRLSAVAPEGAMRSEGGVLRGGDRLQVLSILVYA